MKNISKHLLPDEKINLTIRPNLLKTLLTSKNTFQGLIVILSSVLLKIFLDIHPIFILLAFIVAIILLIPTIFNQHYTIYYITNKRIIKQTDIIGKNYDNTLLSGILDVNVDVSILDGIIGTGTIRFINSNFTEACVLKNIKNPNEIANTVIGLK